MIWNRKTIIWLLIALAVAFAIAFAIPIESSPGA